MEDLLVEDFPEFVDEPQHLDRSQSLYSVKKQLSLPVEEESQAESTLA